MPKPFEILAIVLLRFRALPRAWAIALILVNLGSLYFIDTRYGFVNLLAVLAGISVMAVIYAKLGFVRLLGIGHTFWIPMLVWFALDMPDKAQDPSLYYWVLTLLVFNTISLVIDTIDVARYAAGDRNPTMFGGRKVSLSQVSGAITHRVLRTSQS